MLEGVLNSSIALLGLLAIGAIIYYILSFTRIKKDVNTLKTCTTAWLWGKRLNFQTDSTVF